MKSSIIFLALGCILPLLTLSLLPWMGAQSLGTFTAFALILYFCHLLLLHAHRDMRQQFHPLNHETKHKQN